MVFPQNIFGGEAAPMISNTPNLKCNPFNPEEEMYKNKKKLKQYKNESSYAWFANQARVICNSNAR